MRLLLDTNVWLWGLRSASKISPTARSAIENPDAELFLSPITVWETLLAARKGRIHLTPTPTEFVRDALARSPVTSVPFSNQIALRTHTLDRFSTEDPADRFLVATALECELTLVTADGAMHEYESLKTLW